MPGKDSGRSYARKQAMLSVAGAVILRLGFAASVAAQGTADIVGRVVDSGGGILAGATVTARDLSTNVTRTTAASGTGGYTLTPLRRDNTK